MSENGSKPDTDDVATPDTSTPDRQIAPELLDAHKDVILLLVEMFGLVCTIRKHRTKGVEVKAIPHVDGGLVQAILTGKCETCRSELNFQFFPRQQQGSPIRHDIAECRVSLWTPGDPAPVLPQS